MKNMFYYTLMVFLLIFTSYSSGQILGKSDLEAKIDSLIPTQINDTTPGLVVGVVQNGELIFSKGYGLANLSYGIPNDPKMVYNIGSTSKQFLGYAFAMLHVEGRLNIDDPVSKYLDDWPEFEHTVTLRNLLTHTSGYREAYTMSNLAGRIIGVDRLSREECLEVVRRQAQLEFEPGSRWTYNSTAWVILAEVLEKVTGEAADEWVENNILIPLEMNDTQIESYVGEVIDNGAESYSFDKEQGYINENSNRAFFGAADVYTSIPDLVKWINNYRTAVIGGSAVNDLFLDPFVLNDKSNSEYALGIRNNSYRGLKQYEHSGAHEAFSTQLNYFPDYDLGIVVISNFGGKGRIASSSIADLFLEEFMTSTDQNGSRQTVVEKDILEQFTGLYLASTLNQTLDLTMSENSLSIEGRTILIPTSRNTFGINGWGGQFQFKDAPDGNTQLTIVNGTREIYNRVEKWIPNQEDLTSFKGDYWSEELETVYHLIVTDEKLTIQHRWLGDIVLEPITQDLFMTDWGYNVNFVRSKEGEILGLSIYSGRTLNVFFQRR